MIRLIVKKNAAVYFLVAGLLAGVGASGVAYTVASELDNPGEIKSTVEPVAEEIEEPVEHLTLEDRYGDYYLYSSKSVNTRSSFTIVNNKGHFLNSDMDMFKGVIFKAVNGNMLQLKRHNEYVILASLPASIRF